MHEIRDIFSTVKRNSTLFIPAVYNRQIAHFVTKIVAKCWLVHWLAVLFFSWQLLQNALKIMGINQKIIVFVGSGLTIYTTSKRLNKTWDSFFVSNTVVVCLFGFSVPQKNKQTTTTTDYSKAVFPTNKLKSWRIVPDSCLTELATFNVRLSACNSYRHPSD